MHSLIRILNHFFFNTTLLQNNIIYIIYISIIYHITKIYNIIKLYIYIYYNIYLVSYSSNREITEN